MESGVSPSGRLKREAGGGVSWLGDVAISERAAGLTTLYIMTIAWWVLPLGLRLSDQTQLMTVIGGGPGKRLEEALRNVVGVIEGQRKTTFVGCSFSTTNSRAFSAGFLEFR